MNVFLSTQPATEMWGKNAILSFGDNGATIHVKHDSVLTDIQRAARKLRNQGINDADLEGEGWDLETCWAFYQGFYTAKQNYDLSLPVLDEESHETLLARIICGDFVREIINTPAQHMTPVHLAKEALKFIQHMTQEYAPDSEVNARIIEGKTLLEEDYQGIWAVGKGAKNPPAMLQLDYNPTGNPDAPTFACLVGKGITFDSGGYSIKPTDSMVTMRTDMGGAALLTGALGMAIAAGLNQRVKLVLCCAENMVSAEAMKLGDIIKYSNGVTVEILNTDAEGRLVLADGLIWADQQHPEMIIDAATLTGAAKRAVGTEYHTILSMDEDLVLDLMASAEEATELFWRLPFAKFHRDQIKSQFADIANTATVSSPAGASTATAFLSYFVKDYPRHWLHIDASATFRASPTDLWAAGATGIGVQTLANLLLLNQE